VRGQDPTDAGGARVDRRLDTGFEQPAGEVQAAQEPGDPGSPVSR
jgi:hypothetical protein